MSTRENQGFGDQTVNRDTRSEDTGPGRWRRAVWAIAGTLWLLFLVVIHFAAGLNLAQVIATAIICLGPAGIYELVLALGDRGTSYQIAVGLAMMTAIFLGWVNGAVGIIGSENNPANQMYAGVVAVGVLGTLIARFRARGMAVALFVTALAQLSVPVIALQVWPRTTSWGGAGVSGVFVMNAFFAMLFLASAWMFRSAMEVEPEQGAA